MYPTRSDYETASKNLNDPIGDWKLCNITGQEFPVYQSDTIFLEKMSPSFLGKKFSLPLPTSCYIERLRKVMSFRNERMLYKKKSALTQKDVICAFSPDFPYKTCEYELWHSDALDNKIFALAYNKEI